MAGHLYLNQLYITLFKHVNPTSKDINIICLGESSTSGLWVNREDSYPAQLERKLRDFYSNQNMHVIVPPHVGQNTSQVSNRIQQYISLYKPKLIILMVGYNNEWSLAESNIGEFLDNRGKDILKVKVLIALNNLRLFKLLRYSYLRFIVKDKSEYMQSNKYYIYGHPELVRLPAVKWIYSFANTNRGAFIKLWEYDVAKIIREAKNDGIAVLLMTYHINPTYLPVDEFVAISDEQGIPLVRNDLPFTRLTNDGTINEYLLSDHWHPNKQGYSIIANNAFEYIRDENLLSLKDTTEQ
jgi:lysophospholipase L1-like esterase